MNIDLTDSVVIDLTIEKDKTLNKTFKCEIYTGDTLAGYFNFAPYTAATLTVKNRSNDYVNAVVFSTADSSLQLGSSGEFTILKPASKTAIRTGRYVYEMVLTSSAETRGFLRGRFNVIDESYGEISTETNATTPIRIAVKDDIVIAPQPSTITASNGLTKVGDDIRLGGLLTGNTEIDYGSNNSFYVHHNDGDDYSFFYIGPTDINLKGQDGVEIECESGSLNIYSYGGDLDMYSGDDIGISSADRIDIVGQGFVNIDSVGGSIILTAENESGRDIILNASDRIRLSSLGSTSVEGEEEVNISTTGVGGNVTLGGTGLVVSERKHIFSGTSATDAAIRIGGVAGNPSSLSSGDLWVNNSTGPSLNARLGTNTLILTNMTNADLVGNRVPYIANLSGRMNSNSNFTFDGSTNRLTVSNLSVSNINSTRVVFATAGGAFTDNSNFSFNSSSNLLSVPRIQLSPNATNAGLNVGSFGGVPSGTTNGDIWYNSNDNVLQTKNNNQNRSFIFGTITGTLSAARIAYSSTSGSNLISSNSNFTYNTINNSLNVPKISASTFTIATPDFSVSDSNNNRLEILSDYSSLYSPDLDTFVFLEDGSAQLLSINGLVTLEGQTIFLNGSVIQVSRFITPSATTGNRTINQSSGTVNFAAGTSSLTVTNSNVNADSIVFATVRSNDSTAVIKNVVPTTGSFTISLTATATATTSVGFFVTN